MTKPEETVHPVSRSFYENEVFKTGQAEEQCAFLSAVMIPSKAETPPTLSSKVEDFLGRCLVLLLSKYVRGRPKAPVWTPSMPLYVVEHRYKPEVKEFKKIKNWDSALPEEIRKHEYDMDLYPNGHTELPRKVKSPFARGIVGPGGIGVAKEHDEEEQGKYHFLPGGEPATVQKHKAFKEASEAVRAAEIAANPSASALYAAEKHTSLIHFAAPTRAAPLPPPTPVLPPPPPIDPTLTPAELAVSKESFQPLPSFVSTSIPSPLSDRVSPGS